MINHKRSVFAFLAIILVCSCKTYKSDLLKFDKPGQARIEFQNGSFSEIMTIEEGFKGLKSNQKLHISSGRYEFTEPLILENLENIQITGNNTSLVAKIDMPILQLKWIKNVKISNLHIVHEIGGWCAQNCLEVYNSSKLEITKCKLDGSGYFGLTLTGVREATIKKNEFFNCEYGLAAWKSTYLHIAENTFSDNRKKDIMFNDLKQYLNDVESDNSFKN